jgi:type VI secretion system protein ImpJ
MVGASRVAWREGLFLRPQHFQQQDRFIERLLESRVADLTPYPWGITELILNNSLSEIGKFSMTACAGVLPDGFPVAIPEDCPPPIPMDVPPDTRDAIVYLTLPARQSGAVEYAKRSAGEASLRFAVDDEDVFDSFSEERSAETIETGRPNFRFGISKEQTEGRICLGLARIKEVFNGRVVFDDGYIPPVLNIHVSPRIDGFLNSIIGRAEQRVDELAMRAVEATDGGAETFASFLLLQALNRWIPALVHVRSLPSVHPERLFELFVAMGGELATLATKERRPPAFPTYRHDDLEGVFDPVVDFLQYCLSYEIGRSAGQIPLEAVGPGSYSARISDSGLLQIANFYLAVSARVPVEDLRGRFGSVVKIGSVSRMREIVASSLQAGVRIIPTPTPPQQMRILPGYVYFELDRSAAEWRELANAPALGMHIAGSWPDLKLELWWVKRG